MTTTDTPAELIRIWDSTEARLIQLVASPAEYLEETGEDPEDDPISTFITNDVLEIKREQYLSDREGWITNYYTLVTGTGGPHVEFTTSYRINVYWGGEVLESGTHDDQAREAIDRIEDWLNEVVAK
ncbi:MAG: hypothetical protein PHH09_13005 [Methanoregulaceae archaeon]|nr:hypothetical protein [Methanoregulaceae archaeon]